MQNTFLFRDTESGRRIKIEINLEQREKRPVFTASGEIYAKYQREPYACCQCLDQLEVTMLTDRCSILSDILRLHSLYHLNNCHAGTQEQEDYLKSCSEEQRKEVAEKNGFSQMDSYKIDCSLLKEAGLLTVWHNGTPYTYGHQWLYRAIPDDDLSKIVTLCQLTKTEYKI